jgi:hypothetical protein
MQFRRSPRRFGTYRTTGSPTTQRSHGGQIKGIGNRIRHEYFRLADNILWEVMTIDTHALKTVMEAMLVRHGGTSESA